MVAIAHSEFSSPQAGQFPAAFLKRTFRAFARGRLMSIRLIDLALRKAPYAGGTLLVLIMLCDWANDDGTRIFPHMEQLAEKARLSIRQAQRALRELEDGGIITPVKNASGGRGNRKEYQINVERMTFCHPLKTPIKGDMDDAERVTFATEKGDICDKSPAPPYIDNRQVNRQVSRQEDDDGGMGVPNPKLVDFAIARICEILGIKPKDDQEQIRWTVMVSNMLMDGLDLQKHIIPAVEMARDRAIPNLNYVRKCALTIAEGKPYETGHSPSHREAHLSAHSAFTLGAARAAGLLDEWDQPIVAAGCPEIGGTDELGGGGIPPIEGRITARG